MTGEIKMSNKNKLAKCNGYLSNGQKYIEYFKRTHYEQYKLLMDSFIELNNTGYILDTDKIVEEINDYIKVNEYSNSYHLNKAETTKPLTPKNFQMESTTIWNFPDRGKWATHNSNYRGNWSPYIPRNVILRYSKEKDTVLDQFLGSGTTLVETKLLNRYGIGIDINPDSLKIAKNNLNFNKKDSLETKIKQGDARCLSFIKDNSIDLICTHPPYANIIKYSDNILEDLSHCGNIDEFLYHMQKVASESYRVLKPYKYCAILMGDTRRKRHIVPLGFKVMDIFQKAGFVLKEIVIKEQHNCKTTDFWRQKSIDYNFLLIAHEYLFIFIKPKV